MVFFICRAPEKLTRKPASKSVNGCYTGFSIQERILPLRQSLPVRKCNIGFVYPLLLEYRLLLRLRGFFTWV